MKKVSGRVLLPVLILIILVGAGLAFFYLYKGWIRLGDRAWYWDHGDYVRDSWEEIDGVRYRFDREGKLCRGWLEEKGGRYYFRDGLPLTGEVRIEGDWYCFDDGGLMMTGFVSGKSSGDPVYYYNKDGVRQTGWIERTEGRYYSTDDGLQTGWAEIDGGRYYFKEDGRMAAGWTDIDGRRYCFQKDGRMITGWVREEGILYCLDEEGALRTSCWIEEDKGTYYVDKEGKAVSGKKRIDGIIYLFGKDCRLKRNAWVGNSHSDGDGIMQTDCLVDGLFIDSKGDKVFGGGYGDGGNLFMDSVGIEVPLYKTQGDEHGQAITDRTYSAAWLTSFNMPVIADHKNQGFERIKSCIPGKTKALILTRNSVTEYRCRDVVQGSNVEDDILDDHGVSIDESGADLCLYTCNEDWRHVTIVYFSRVN